MLTQVSRKARHAVWLLAVLVQLFTPAQAVAEPKCDVPPELLRFDHALHELAAQPEIRIVALGASSTKGFGASSPAAAYPNRLQAELARLLPNKKITVHNKGENGEEVTDTHKRFENDVLALKPDLLIWQLGTNEVIMNRSPFDEIPALVHADLEKARAAGIKIIFMDLQYAETLEAKSGVAEMESLIATMARNENANLYKRYESMKYWIHGSHQPMNAFLYEDHFHPNDAGYRCVAHNLADAIFEAVTREPAQSNKNTRKP